MNLNLKEFFSIIIPYLAIVSCAYLFGFWGAFNVNALEYIGVTDIIKISIYPLSASLAYVGIGILISELSLRPSLPVGGGAESTIGKFGKKHWQWLLTFVTLLIFSVISFGHEPFQWFFVAILASTFAIPLSHVEKIAHFIPEPKIRTAILFYILFLPFISFAYGRVDAYVIRSGGTAKIVDITRSQLSLKEDIKHPVYYLGFIGGIYILFESLSGETVYVKQDNIILYTKPR